MSDKRPAFQWYPKDYLSDENVVPMTLEEEGAYRRLMDFCWLHGSLPNDMRKLGAMCKIDGSRMAELWPAVENCFQLEADRWVHPRLEKERMKQDKHRKAKSDAGKMGAKARWEKGENGSAIDLPMAKNGSSSASASAIKKTTTSYPDEFEEFWELYPRRKGSNPKAKALSGWRAATKKPGVTPDRILDGVREYRAFCEREGKIGSPFVAMAGTWLNQERWDDDLGDDEPEVELVRSW